MSLVTCPPLSGGGPAAFSYSSFTGRNWIVWASGVYVLIFSEKLELLRIVSTQCPSSSSISSLAMNKESGIIAVSYGLNVELLHPLLNGEEIQWSQSVVLGQDFVVYNLIWKSSEILFMVGSALAVWERVGNGNRGSQNQVWIKIVKLLLPVPVKLAMLSPDGAYLATISDIPNDFTVRIYNITWSSRGSPLSLELGKLLGRSFSQNLDFSAGSAFYFQYFPLLMEEKPLKISWANCQYNPTDSSPSKNALMVNTSLKQVFFIEDFWMKLVEVNDLFVPCWGFEMNDFELHWWLNDQMLCNNFEALMKIFDSGYVSLLAIPFKSNDETRIFRIGNLDSAHSNVVILEEMLNVTCTWPEILSNISKMEFVYLFMTGRFAFNVDFSTSRIWVSKLSPATSEIGGIMMEGATNYVREEIMSDFNYDYISALNVPSLKGFLSNLYTSHYSPLLCILDVVGKVTVFYTESLDKKWSIPYQPPFCMKVLRPSNLFDFIWGISFDSQLFALFPESVINLSNIEKVHFIIGEYEENGENVLLYCSENFIYRTEFLIDLDGQCITVGEPIEFHSEILKQVTGISFLGIDFCGQIALLGICRDNAYFLMKNGSECISCYHLNITEDTQVIMNNSSDIALVEILAEKTTITIVNLYPGFKDSFYSHTLGTFPEKALGFCWGQDNRELFVAFPSHLSVYSATLTENGSEMWVESGTGPWPNLFGTKGILGSSSFIITVTFDNCILISVDGIVFQMDPILSTFIEDEKSKAISEKTRVFIIINNVIADRFDLLPIKPVNNVSIEFPCENMSIRKPHSELFSFFDEITFVDSVESVESVRPPSLEPFELLSTSGISKSASQSSLGPSKNSYLFSSALQAAMILSESQSSLDRSGCKYLFFSKFSWDLPGIFATYGFEHLAASFSDGQEILIAKTLELMGKDRTWDKFSHCGMGFWVRNTQRLKEILEDVARSDFMIHKDPASCAVLYLILGRRQVLKTLWKAAGVADAEGSRMVTFLSSNFEEEKTKIIAVKNAFAALAKQRPKLAVIFFILAGKFEDALKVCFSRLKDYHLGFLIARFLCDQLVYDKIMRDHVTGNTDIPLCVRGLILRANNPEIDIFDLIMNESNNDDQNWSSSPGLCLPLAISCLRNRPLPEEFLISSIYHLCYSGCYEIAASVAQTYSSAVPESLALLTRILSNRWK